MDLRHLEGKTDRTGHCGSSYSVVWGLQVGPEVLSGDLRSQNWFHNKTKI